MAALTQEKKLWVAQRVDFWWEKLCTLFGEQLVKPEVRFSKMSMTRRAGVAFFSKNVVLLSSYFLMNEEESVFDRTIAHELAHMAVDVVNGRRMKHSSPWRNTMKALGLSTNRCHNYISTKYKRQDRVMVFCNCEKSPNVTKNLYSRIKKGSYYRCRHCKSMFSPYSSINTNEWAKKVFAKHAPRFGLNELDFCRVINISRNRMLILGFNLSSKKYPIIVGDHRQIMYTSLATMQKALQAQNAIR